MQTRAGLLRGSSFFRNGLMLYVNRTEETFQTDYHAHDFLEITYVSEGRGYHHLGGKVISVAKGDVFLLPVGLPHVFRPSSAEDGQKLAVYNCVFSDELLLEAASRVPDVPLASLFGREACYLRDRRLTIEPLYQRMHEEFAKQRAGSAGMLFALFLQLLIQLSRMIDQQETPVASPVMAADPVGDAIDYIRRHASEKLSRSMLANRCGISERHFARLFKARTGQPFLQYVLHERIRLGCELLLGTRHNIGVVAEMVGYKDMQTFHQTFKRIVGATPGEYRKLQLSSVD